MVLFFIICNDFPKGKFPSHLCSHIENTKHVVTRFSNQGCWKHLPFTPSAIARLLRNSSHAKLKLPACFPSSAAMLAPVAAVLGRLVIVVSSRSLLKF